MWTFGSCITLQHNGGTQLQLSLGSFCLFLILMRLFCLTRSFLICLWNMYNLTFCVKLVNVWFPIRLHSDTLMHLVNYYKHLRGKVSNFRWWHPILDNLFLNFVLNVTQPKNANLFISFCFWIKQFNYVYKRY